RASGEWVERPGSGCYQGRPRKRIEVNALSSVCRDPGEYLHVGDAERLGDQEDALEVWLCPPQPAEVGGLRHADERYPGLLRQAAVDPLLLELLTELGDRFDFPAGHSPVLSVCPLKAPPQRLTRLSSDPTDRLSP